MQHLEAERLAALDHDAPTAEELAHLAACAGCRAEWDAFGDLRLRAQEAAAQDLPDGARLTSWDSLSRALRTEGLLTSTFEITPVRTPLVVRSLHGAAVDSDSAIDATVATTTDGVRPARDRRTASVKSRGWAGTWTRAAAAMLLVIGGAMAGRVSAGGSALPIAIAGGADMTSDASNTSMGVALQGTSFGGRDAFSSVEDANDALSDAQRVYERASLWLASNDTTTRSSDVYRARLAALDQMMAASRSALRDAPQDPVLNHYFLAAYTAREATLQQMTSALPVDKTLESY
ncbi:MAG: hypothetical protein V4617_00915 [Gemmatimonadota bacterium]